MLCYEDEIWQARATTEHNTGTFVLQTILCHHEQ